MSVVDSIWRTNHDPQFRKSIQEAYDAGRESMATKRTDYVAVLRRAIPVNDRSTDTSTHIIQEGETVREVMDWAER